jgi:hypothetical protein
MNGREREDAWLRSRRFVGYKDPSADHNGYEKWPVFSAAVPPELAAELDAAQRKSLGINASKVNATRANLVRAGLRLYLNAVDPPTAARRRSRRQQRFPTSHERSSRVRPVSLSLALVVSAGLPRAHARARPYAPASK